MNNFGYESSFEKNDKKCRELKQIFLSFFLQFFGFFSVFLDNFLVYYDLPIALRAPGWIPYWLKIIFFGIICFGNMKKLTNFFQF